MVVPANFDPARFGKPPIDPSTIPLTPLQEIQRAQDEDIQANKDMLARVLGISGRISDQNIRDTRQQFQNLGSQQAQRRQSFGLTGTSIVSSEQQGLAESEAAAVARQQDVRGLRDIDILLGVEQTGPNLSMLSELMQALGLGQGLGGGGFGGFRPNQGGFGGFGETPAPIRHGRGSGAFSGGPTLTPEGTLVAQGGAGGPLPQDLSPI